jgi:hypothetical protein
MKRSPDNKPYAPRLLSFEIPVGSYQVQFLYPAPAPKAANFRLIIFNGAISNSPTGSASLSPKSARRTAVPRNAIAKRRASDWYF